MGYYINNIVYFNGKVKSLFKLTEDEELYHQTILKSREEITELLDIKNISDTYNKVSNLKNASFPLEDNNELYKISNEIIAKYQDIYNPNEGIKLSYLIMDNWEEEAEECRVLLNEYHLNQQI